MLRILFAAALLVLPYPVWADAFSDAAGYYKVQPSSAVHFSVAQAGGQAIEGTFRKFKGGFELEGSDVRRSKVDISIEAGSVQAVDPRIEAFIRSPPVFDADNYPTIRFISTSVRRTGEKSATIEGRLSAKGHTRPARFTVNLLERSGRTLKFHVTGKLSRALFGMDVGTPIYSNVVLLDMTFIGRR